MGLFGNKGKDNNNVAAAKQINKVDDLSKVLDESVWESVHEDLKANKQFIINRDGQTQYVVFMIETAQFGGLAGRDAKKDESKGSIIEAIKTGRIKTYLPMDMLRQGIIVIIPDENTIENMDEFNIFNNIDYILSTIDSDGLTETKSDASGNEISYKFGVIRDMVRQKGDVNDLFTGAVGPHFDNGSSNDEIEPDPDEIEPDPDEASGTGVMAMEMPEIREERDRIDEPTDEPEVEPEVEPEPEESEQIPEDIPESDSSPVEDYSDLGGSPDVSDAGQNDQDGFFDNNGSDENYLNGDTGGYDEYEDVTADVVNDFVVRKFFSNDLGLEVSTQSFDAQFLHRNEYIPFNENRGSGWLNEYLSNFSKDANTRMERMHSENLFRLRESYMRTIQTACEKITEILDISNDTTQYGKIKAAITRTYDDNMDNLDRAIEDKRDQLEQMWQEQLIKVGEAEKAKAIENYKKEYGDKHQSDMDRLRETERNEIENDYQASMRALNEARRAEATKLLDVAINKALNKMSDAYVDILESERAEYEKYHEEMLKFIDDNRKDERARIEALAEENRQVKKANEVRGEYIAKIKAMAAEFDMKRTVLQSELDNMRREHESDIQNHENTYASKIAAERSRADSLQTQLDTLLQQYSELEDKKNKELEERVKIYKDDAALKDTQMQHIIQSSKKSNALTIGLCAALLIAGLGIGFLFGHSGLGNQSANTSAPVSASVSLEQSVDTDADTVVEDKI